MSYGATGSRGRWAVVGYFLPGAGDYREVHASWKGDIVAGITVGVVALPLAPAFAIAAGLNPSVGLMTTIEARLVAGVFGGSVLLVSGPTKGMQSSSFRW